MAGEQKGSSGLGSFFGAKSALSFALIAILVAGVFSTALTMVLQKAYAGTLDDLVITPSDSRTSVTTVYTITAKTDTKGMIEAVEIDFPAAYAIADCASPCGTYTLVEIKKLRNDGEFSAVAADDTITYTMPRVASIRAGAQFSMTVEGIVNPTDAESHSITVSTLDKDGNTIDSDTIGVTISSSLSSTDADDGLTIENTGGSITIDASDDLNLEADGATIKLNALDDAESEIEITDSIAGVGGGTVTLNAALSTQTLSITGDMTITDATPLITLADSTSGTVDDDASIGVEASVLTLDVDTDTAGSLTINTAGLITSASVNSASIVDDSVASGDILANTIVPDDIAANTISSDESRTAATTVTADVTDNRAGNTQTIVVIVSAEILEDDAADSAQTITLSNADTGTISTPASFDCFVTASDTDTCTAVFYVTGAGAADGTINLTSTITTNDTVNDHKIVAFALPG